MNLYFIKDSVFRRLSIPIPAEQQRKLEESLIRDGCKEPICVWNNIILDGYKRFDFCRDEGINFTVKELSFSSESKAVCWVCRKKIPGYPKNSAAYHYLVGKFYEAMKQRRKEAVKVSDEDETIFLTPFPRRVSIIVAEELGLNHCTVEAYGAYARSLDTIYLRSYKLFETILLGETRMSMRGAGKLAELPEGEFRAVVRKKYHITEEPPSSRMTMRQRKKGVAVVKKEIPLEIGIKEMPTFDPDMEIRGLALTIPTWILSIARAERKTDMNLASEKGKKELAEALEKLSEQALCTLEALR